MNHFRGKTVNTAVLVVKSDKGTFYGLYCVFGIKKEQCKRISILSAVWYYSAIVHEKNKTKLKKHKYWTRSEKPLRFIPIKQNNMFYLLFHGPGLP